MENKRRDLLIVSLLYIISIALGTGIYFLLADLPLITRLLIADLGAMLFIYIFSLILNNASLYDAYWSVIPMMFFIIGFIVSDKTLDVPYFMFLFATSFWAIRLTINWGKGWDGFSHVDWRYLRIRDKSPKLYFLTNFLAIQLLPTLIVFAQILVGIKIIELGLNFNFLFMVGFLMIITATIIQYIADEQMRNFRTNKDNKGKCIDEGLWKYSRHPNYFGEIMVWWGLYIMYVSKVQQLDFYIIAPILMTLLFLFISIPMMERKILRTRPQYKEYQKKVSMLIPFFRKEDKKIEVQDTN